VVGRQRGRSVRLDRPRRRRRQRNNWLVTLGLAAILAASVGFSSGAWWQHGRSSIPPPEVVQATVTMTATATVRPTATVDASPFASATPTPFPEDTPAPTVVIEYRDRIVVEYVRCWVRTVTATLNAAGKQVVAESGWGFCPD
jgi:hypothetical protein